MAQQPIFCDHRWAFTLLFPSYFKKAPKCTVSHLLVLHKEVFLHSEEQQAEKGVKQ